MTTYIQNEQHYNDVLERIPSVKESLWIGSADIKDLYVKVGKEATPFLGILADEPELLDAATEQFDSVWRGSHCPKCGRRDLCGDPVK